MKCSVRLTGALSLISGFPEHSLRSSYNLTIVALLNFHKLGEMITRGKSITAQVIKFLESCLWHSGDKGENRGEREGREDSEPSNLKLVAVES